MYQLLGNGQRKTGDEPVEQELCFIVETTTFEPDRNLEDCLLGHGLAYSALNTLRSMGDPLHCLPANSDQPPNPGATIC